MSPKQQCFLAATVLLTWGASAGAEQPPDIVAIEDEPRHLVAFESASVRVIRGRFPPGYTTLYHPHERDSVYVLISGNSNLVNQPLGEPEKPFSAKSGDVFFGAHSKKVRVHRFSNLSDEEHLVLDIELIAKSISAGTPLPVLQEHQSPVMENDKVRVSRIWLEPGESTVLPVIPASRFILVVVAGSRMGTTGNSGELQNTAVVPGWFHASNDYVLRSVINSGKDRLELVSLEIR